MDSGGRDTERRGGLRVEASLAVQYQSVDELVGAYTENISRGGMFVRTTDLLPVGAVVRVSVTLPTEAEPVSAAARVTHVESAGMGVEFLDVGGEPIADRIVRYLASLGYDDPLPPSPAGLSATVLVVDDDDEYRARVVSIVEDAGHRAIEARNGLDAMKRALEAPPDLIVTDIEMPALDGWQFVRLVRARPALASTPIILFSSRLGDDERLRAYQLGVADFIGKPFHDDELGMAVQRALERARAYPRDPARAGGLRGDLTQVSLARVLSLLGSEQREGVLLLVNNRELATLYVRAGKVVRVELPDDFAHLEGMERLFHVLDWVAGRFEFSVAEVAGDGLDVPIATALLQHSMLDGEDDTRG